MSSISARISFGFFALVLLILILAALTFSDLRFLASQIQEGAAVARFVERALEMRRLEKNYFLYRERANLDEAMEQAGLAVTLLAENAPLLAVLCGGRACDELSPALQAYRDLLLDLAKLPPQAVPEFEDRIRQAGHRVTELSQGLSDDERGNLATALVRSGRWLLGVVLLAGVLGVLLGTAIARSVVRPLHRLEVDLASIAEGRFHELPEPSRDRELVSFAAAFNRMLAELENRRRQLLQSEKMASLGVLVSGVAHELNNPLSNLSTACQLAQEDMAAGDLSQMGRWLRQIDEQTERARQIVLALSDYARRRPLTLEPVDVNLLLDSTLLLMRKELGRQVTLERDLPPGLAIIADRQRLQQVFINLLKNAADAGGPEVTITITGYPLDLGVRVLPQGRYRLGELPRPRDGDPPNGRRYALISIADNGPGIPPEVLKQIFDPFFTTREVGQGMGLGLYIVQEIVQDLNGSIAVDSEPGRGTRFELALPCALPDRGPADD
jgi:two-component system, NtrC family, sensor kinase